AWIADDHEPEAAPACRQAGAWLARRAGGQDLLLADLHRRNGEFGAAVAAARRALEDCPDPRLAALARHQLELVAASDRDRHSMVDLFARTAGEAM
ncbi:MAG: tetratricopeptide repeat protein, partial [Chloroflexota bacterium]